MPPPQGTHFVSVPALSPDGRQIVFVAVPDDRWPYAALAPAAVRRRGDCALRDEGASYPFWSPDSRSVGFFADGKLKRVGVPGGGPIELCDAAAGRGGLWLDDDTIVFAPSQYSPLMRVSAAGGEPVAAHNAG